MLEIILSQYGKTPTSADDVEYPEMKTPTATILFLAVILSRVMFTSAAVAATIDEQGQAIQTPTFWGEATNSLKAAIRLYPQLPIRSTSAGLRTSVLRVYVLNVSTNRLGQYFLPKAPERYSINLRTDNGAAVKMTRLGEIVGKPVSHYESVEKRRLQGHEFQPGREEEIAIEIDLGDLFVIDKPGTYSGDFRLRILGRDEKAEFKTIELPPVAFKVEVTR